MFLNIWTLISTPNYSYNYILYYISIYIFLYKYIYIFLYLSIYLSIYPSIYLSIYLSIYNIYIYIYIYIYMKLKYGLFLQWNTKFFSSESPTSWILLNLYELCESCRRNPLETLECKSYGHWRTKYLSICYFAPVISQRYIKYILLHSSKLLAYFFHVRLI